MKKYLVLVLLSSNLSLINISYAQKNSPLETVIVTATREMKPKSEVVESVSVISSDEIDFVSPTHPAELLNRTAGVYINNLGGEGHMTSIRQPLTTGGVYLFLEDGIPTRPTGLFNHNALYEINVPQAERIEVIKGPGSALYGSDSIGGIINSITKPSSDKKELAIDTQYGSYGWKRLLATGGAPINSELGFRTDLNLVDNDGYRDESEYQRYSTTTRLDGLLSDDTLFKTILSYHHINQSGVSGLGNDDYRQNPERNFFHNNVGRRLVNALRLSTEFSYEPNKYDLYTITPFFRHNEMELMPSWMLTYDPNDRHYEFQSYGLLAKYRRKMPAIGVVFIAGTDIDYTPSTYQEIRLNTIIDNNIYTGTTPTGRTNYDFDANQLSISPYLHGEWQALQKLRLTAGLRYDYFSVDYQDNLDGSVLEQQIGRGGFNHQRPDSQRISYDNLSPKLGLIYKIVPEYNLYMSYRHSFRVPAIGQLFRAGSSMDTATLKPVKTYSFEIGARGQTVKWLSYELTFYRMLVKNDIVSYIDNASNSRRVINAGETKHQGIELSLLGDISDQWKFHSALSLRQQKYKNYTAIFGFPAREINYTGNDVGKAPKILANTVFQYHPTYIPKAQFELEWQHVGDYYTDETNTQKYDGHNLFNMRASYQVKDNIKLYGHLMNFTNKLYANYASNQVGDPSIEYRPGLPRTLLVGLNIQF